MNYMVDKLGEGKPFREWSVKHRMNRAYTEILVMAMNM